MSSLFMFFYRALGLSSEATNLPPCVQQLLDSKETEIAGKKYSHLIESDPAYYTAATIQKLISENAHLDGMLDVLISTLGDDDPKIIKQAMIESRSVAGGLFNLGNTCWLNAAIQGLFSTLSPLRNLLKEKSTSSPRCKEFLDLLNQKDLPANQANNEKLYDLMERFQTNFFQANPALAELWAQQDAAQGIHALLEYFELSDIFTLSQGNNDIYPDAVEVQRLITQESIFPLKQVSEKKASSLQELIDFNITQSESLETGAKRYQYFTATEDVSSPILFSIPRFNYDPIQQTQVIDSDFLIIEENVQVPLFSEEGKVCEFILELQLSQVIGYKRSQETVNSGHYVCYTKCEDGYLLYNDSQVKKLSRGEAYAAMIQEGYIALYNPVKKRLAQAHEVEKYAINHATTHQLSPIRLEEEEEFFTPPSSPQMSKKDFRRLPKRAQDLASQITSAETPSSDGRYKYYLDRLLMRYNLDK